MDGNIDEQLSALLDGELPEEQEELLLRRLERSESHRATLARYSLIGELLRGDRESAGATELPDRVRRVVASEHAPPGARPPSDWRFSLVGAGMAAAVVWFAVGSLINPASETPGLPEPVTAVVLPSQEPDILPAVTRPSVRTSTVIAPARLTSYLVSHGSYAGGLSRQVMNSHFVNQTPEFLNVSLQGRNDVD